jgi:hypothetical protein
MREDSTRDTSEETGMTEAPSEDYFAMAGTERSVATRTFVPNMIGDFFGAGTSCSQITIPIVITDIGSFDYTSLPGQTQGQGPYTITTSSMPNGTFAGLSLINTEFGSTVDRRGVVDSQFGTDPYHPIAIVPSGPSQANPSDNLTAHVQQRYPGATFVEGQAELVQAVPQITSSRYQVNTVGDQSYPYDDADIFRFAFYYDQNLSVCVPHPGNGGVVGRTKISENTSPFPQDRVLFSYSYFDHAPLNAAGVHVQRFTPGFEKTFFDGMSSLEVKVPMALTLNSDINPDSADNTGHAEFGNLVLTSKLLLLDRDSWGVSAGMTLALPTADDIRVAIPGMQGMPLVRIRNESVLLGPFLGWRWLPNDQFFAQAFLQYDFDVSGSPVAVNSAMTGLLPAGTMHATAFQYLDIGVGYWLFRDIALTGELHWNASLGGSDSVQSANFTVGSSGGGVDVVNAVAGVHTVLAKNTTLTTAIAVPIGGDRDQQFDAELRVMFNQFFGLSSRARRGSFGY